MADERILTQFEPAKHIRGVFLRRADVAANDKVDWMVEDPQRREDLEARIRLLKEQAGPLPS